MAKLTLEVKHMQDFIYKQIEDYTFCVMRYQGDEAEVVIPESRNVTVLFDKLFARHKEITSVYIPDSVTDFGEFLFDGCENLRHIELPSSLTSLWGYTFCRSGFEEVILPDKLACLPPFAFKDCKNLKRVVCGAGMKKIHAWVFGGCDQLEEVVCGPNVEISPEAYKTKVLNT